jgi:hypothetical protein
MSFEAAKALADAVLLEGYVLYPYRASAVKNRYRWTFGVLAPRSWSEAGNCEEWWLEAQCLTDPGTRVSGLLRFLQVDSRRIEAPDGTALESLDCEDQLYVSWEEGRVHEIDLGDLTSQDVIEVAVGGGDSVEEIRDAQRTLRGRVRRHLHPLRAKVRIHVEAADPFVRLCIRLENVTPFEDLAAPRDRALRGALVSTHLVLGASDGGFHSAIDPPAAAAACRNVRTWPVLAGPAGSRDTMLCAPIILYDHAAISPESQGDLFDATEIDEILSLRSMLLTDEEKRQARATDPRAAQVIDRVDHLPPELLSRLHGALRGLQGGEMVPRPRLAKGARVVLRPGKYRTDAQDLLYSGHRATIEEVHRDEEGREYLAVTIDDDPAAELNRWYGRFHYYRPDEVDPL